MFFERLLSRLFGSLPDKDTAPETTVSEGVLARSLEGRSVNERLEMAGLTREERRDAARLAQALVAFACVAARGDALLAQAVFAMERRMAEASFARLPLEERIALVLLTVRSDLSPRERVRLIRAVAHVLQTPQARSLWRTGVAFLSGSAKVYAPLSNALTRATIAQELLNSAPLTSQPALTLHLALLASPAWVLQRALRRTPEALYIVESAVRGLTGKEGERLFDAQRHHRCPAFAPVWLTDPETMPSDGHRLPNVRALLAPRLWAQAFLSSLSDHERSNLACYDTLLCLPLEGPAESVEIRALGRALQLAHPALVLVRLMRTALDRIADETARNPALERFFFFDDPEPLNNPALARCRFTGLFVPLDYMALAPALWLPTLTSQGAAVDPAPFIKRPLAQMVRGLPVAPADDVRRADLFPVGLPVGDPPHPQAVLRYCAVTERPVWGAVLVVHTDQALGLSPSSDRGAHHAARLLRMSLTRAFADNTLTTARLAARRELALQQKRARMLPTLTRSLTPEALEVLDPVLTVRERERLSRSCIGEILLEGLLMTRGEEEHATDASAAALLHAFARDTRQPLMRKPRGLRRTPTKKKPRPQGKAA